MVAFTTSLFFFVHTIALSNALPTPYFARSLEARRPTFGQTITMSKTVNNAAAGTFTTTGGDITLTVGESIAAGSAGQVFKVNCGADAACNALGPVVMKFYTDKDQVAPEQQHLAKIDELKAVSTGAGDKLTLMKGFTGKSLSQTDAYLALTAKVTDKTKLDIPKITKLVQDAATLAETNGIAYLTQHQILHLDINDANVLFTESGGRITAAQLIDWDKAQIVPAGDIEAAKEGVTGQKIAFDRLFETPELEKQKADAAAKKAGKATAAPPAAAAPVAAAAPGSAKPAAAAAVPVTPPAAVRPATVPRPAGQASVPPPSGGRPAVPAAAPANRRP